MNDPLSRNTSYDKQMADTIIMFKLDYRLPAVAALLFDRWNL